MLHVSSMGQHIFSGKLGLMGATQVPIFLSMPAFVLLGQNGTSVSRDMHCLWANADTVFQTPHPHTRLLWRVNVQH